MGTPLSVLIVEDSPEDAELVRRALIAGGYDPSCDRVATAEAMGAALERPWDAIVADYEVPSFGALAALALVRRRELDLPFIVISGVAGEATAVAAVKEGAHDFIIKSQLGQLPTALARELREVAARAEQRRVREQLMISERMASAGTLAAGLTHEINNPLAVVAANLETLSGTLAKLRSELVDLGRTGDLGDEPRWTPWLSSRITQIEEPLGDARDAATRIRDLVQSVKLFSGTRNEGSGPVDVRAVAESACRLAWNEIRHRARLRKEFGDVAAVEASEGRLGLVVLNLLVNAAQAIPEGHANENEVCITTRAAGDGRVALEVLDTGGGIAPELLERIFDPFFTTKPVGGGAGLGLAICHRIVADFGGSMSVESQTGKGSVFRVLLPVSRHSIAAPAPPPELKPARRGRVLLVDDEPAVCKAISRMLSRHHEVTSAGNGREALERIVAGERFDVIVSDLMMPEITGMDLHEELARRVPELANRMLFLTGGAFTPRARTFLEEIPNPRIDKPFELDELLALISNLL